MRAVLAARGPRLALESVIVVLLVVAGFWYGRFAALHASAPPDYHYLSPAISVAAGLGFEEPRPADGSPLAEFIAGRAATVTHEQAAATPVGPPNQFHYSARYLINVVGYWWRIAGISWAGIANVAGGLHALTVIGSYGLLRLLVPWPFAIVGALWMGTSTLLLALVPHVRDYSKGAFIVCALPLVVMLALRELRGWRLPAVAAATGAVIGLGLGFKMDVAIMVPTAIAGIVMFRGGRPWSELGPKAVATVVLLVALVVASAPVLFKLSGGGSNAIHVVLLGYSEGFDNSLGINASTYGFLPFYSDAYVARVVQAHSGLEPWLHYPSSEYDRAGQLLWFDLMRHFPADVFARALAAANAVMNLCFTNRDPSFLTSPAPAQEAFVAVYGWLNRWNGLGVVVAGLFVSVAAWHSFRSGALAVFLLLVLAGYPSLQFESRHYFHTQIVPVVAILVLAWAVVAGLMGALGKRVAAAAAPKGDARARSGFTQVLAATVLAVALTAVPLLALRAYQSGHLASEFTRYLATRAQLQTASVGEPAGSTLVTWSQEGPKASAPITLRADHYVVEFQDDGSREPINVGVRYDATTAEHDYSRVLSIRPVAGANRVGFTALNVAGQSEFAGIEVGAASLRRLTGVYRVSSLGPAGLPLDVRLPADWSDRTLFQRLSLEGPDERAVPQRHVVCPFGGGCRHLLGFIDRIATERLSLTGEAVGMIHSDLVTAADGRISIDGPVDSESSYLLQLAEGTAVAGGAFVAEGHLTEGGIVIGLLKDRAWYKQVIIKAPGDFAVVIPIDQPGLFMPMITNAMSPGQRVNRAAITKAGFLEPR